MLHGLFQLPFWIFLTPISHTHFSKIAMDNGRRWSKLLHTSVGIERDVDEEEKKELIAHLLR